METKDLMIGDIVQVNKDVCIKKGTIVRVTAIDEQDSLVNYNLKGCAHCVNINDDFENGGVWVAYLEPIPFTAEILEKNGFVIGEGEGNPTFPYLVFIIKNDEYRVEITWYDSHDVYEPNTGKLLRSAPEVWTIEILSKCGNYDCGKNKIFVHELQHALRLCGIDKTIEL